MKGSLSENGVQGIATLDLYFDNEANVDESRSKFSGGHRMIRGLLVKATRLGVLEWFQSDALRLRKVQFRNQHYHASFEISFALGSSSEVTRVSPGSYSMLRRKNAPTSCC